MPWVQSKMVRFVLFCFALRLRLRLRAADKSARLLYTAVPADSLSCFLCARLVS